jgi:hypothetical protein
MTLEQWLENLQKEEQEKTAAANLEAVFDHLPLEEIIKIAKGDPTYTVRPYSWMDGQKAQTRAMRAGDKGVDVLLAHPDLVKSRMKRLLIGGALGGAGGYGAGRLLGGSKGGMIGGAIGGVGGVLGGVMSADHKHLKERGIKQRWVGLGAPHMTEEAAKKYLKEDEPRSKVAFVEKIARHIAQEHVKVAACKKSTFGEDMESTGEFTSPEAKQKAGILAKAMKTTKGAPPAVRKGAVKLVGREINKIGRAGTQVIKAVLKNVGKHTAAGAAGGAAIGGLAGAATGKDGERGRETLKGALMGGTLGGAMLGGMRTGGLAGGTLGALHGMRKKKPSVDGILTSMNRGDLIGRTAGTFAGVAGGAAGMNKIRSMMDKKKKK